MVQMKILIVLFFSVSTHCFATYYSQCEQDQFVHENFFWETKSGIFVEIGAHNGITYSNTYFFEKEMGWTGICAEPIPEVYTQLAANRNCICIQGCITDHSGPAEFVRVFSPLVNCEMLSGIFDKYDPRHIARVQFEIFLYGGKYEIIEVGCYLLMDVLKKNQITHVNFLSIDTEGGEFDILESIDFDHCKIDVITVEDNYEDLRFLSFLKEKGYQFVTRLDQDLIFVHRDFQPSHKH